MTTASPLGLRRFGSGLQRGVLGALAVAVLILAQPSPAVAQLGFCSNHKCKPIICFPGDENHPPFCITFWAGCYQSAPNTGNCQCPLGSSSTCVPGGDALTGDGGPPTDQQLVDEGFDVCHELMRERMKTGREVVLFDKEAAPAVLTGPSSVGVSGFAHPRAAVVAKDPGGPLHLGPSSTPEDEPVGRRFDCEVRRGDNGAWTLLSLTLAEEQE